MKKIGRGDVYPKFYYVEPPLIVIKCVLFVVIRITEEKMCLIPILAIIHSHPHYWHNAIL